MPIGDYPILEILLRQLKEKGVTEVLFAVGYLGHLIRAYLGDGRRLGLDIRYSEEGEPLGTAGPIGLVMDQLKENFLILNGDLLTTLSFDKLYKFHIERNADATISLFRRQVKIDFGVIRSNERQELEQYIEKPTYDFSVSMGINVLKKSSVIPFIKPGQHCDLPDLMMNLKKSGARVLCYEEDCSWLDIGRSEDYALAQEIFEERRGEFLTHENVR